MKSSRQQIIAICCAMLLQLGLFASLTHEVEHPFHVNGDLCASFINFGQQDLSSDVVSLHTQFQSFSVDVTVDSYQAIELALYFHYSSRAPPAA